MNTLNTGNELSDKALGQSNLVIVTGAQWGDEGKGKAVSAFQGRSIEYVVGPNGGGNAGHTVYYKGQKLDFHELPGGSVIEGAKVYLAKGKVIQISTLVSEIEKLGGAGINLKDKIIIGGGAQVILKSFQQKLDADIEILHGGNAVGTTKKGIGPAYAAQALRIGLTIKEIFTMSAGKLQERSDVICGLFSGIRKEDLISEIIQEREKLRHLVSQGFLTIDYDDTTIFRAAKAGNNIVVEQSQSFLLGKEGGAYPYCTSSDTSIHGMMSSMNIPYTIQPVVIGTIKAIMSKVGGGHLATKMGHEANYRAFEGNFARQTGELGVTTGRLRDLGWVDMPALRHATQINPLSILLVTKSDVLAVLSRAQEENTLRSEMRFYTDFTNPETGDTKSAGVMCGAYNQGNYDSIELSGDTEKNIARFGEKIRTHLPEFNGPIFFGTGPEEHEIMQYNN